VQGETGVVDRSAVEDSMIMASQNRCILPHSTRAAKLLGSIGCATARASPEYFAFDRQWAGLGHRRGDGLEALEQIDTGHDAPALVFKQRPDRLVRAAGVLVRLAMSAAPMIERSQLPLGPVALTSRCHGPCPRKRSRRGLRFLWASKTISYVFGISLDDRHAAMEQADMGALDRRVRARSDDLLHRVPR
jgi:hypothetical protein